MTNERSHSPNWVLALVAIGSFMVALDTLVVSTALTTIRLDLDASIEQLEWTVNAYNLSLAVLLLPAAVLGDRFGRRRLFGLGLGLFVAASAACALAPDVGWLIAARAVQGCGAALVTSLALALVSAAFPIERRGAVIGIMQAIVGLALIAGPVVGGVVTAGISWEWIFWLNVPLGVALLPFVIWRIEESFGDDTALDLGGVALVGSSVLGVVWGLMRGASVGWGSIEVVGSLMAGVVLAVAFVAWEGRARTPMLPMGLFSSRAFSAGNGATFALFGSIFVGVFFIAQFLQTGLGYTPLGAGLRLLPWTGLLFVVAPFAGRLADRVGERSLLVGGLSVHALGYAWLALIIDPDLAYSAMVAPLVVIALGGSAAMPAAASSVMRSIPEGSLGKAAGANSMLRELGGVFGIAIGAAVFADTGSYASAATFSDGFAAALLVPVSLSLLGAIVATAIPKREQETDLSQHDRSHPAQPGTHEPSSVNPPPATIDSPEGRKPTR
jgi:EmrB/QacA subfamily drug resistance transporter